MLMQQAVTLLHECYNTSLTLNDLAGRLNLSKTHFRRLFHAYTGKSPKEFLVSIRIAEAKHLLLEGMPMKQVAIAVGYEDLFYFMRVFKKNVGIPPGLFANTGDRRH
jgi:iron complex transport system substrate-binding protein